MEFKRKLNRILELAFEEDFGTIGDITTDNIFTDEKGAAFCIAKQEGVLCGAEIAESAFKYLDSSIDFRACIEEGDYFKTGDIIFTVEGKIKSILKAERTALNFVQRLSGIATKTYKLSSLIKNNKVKLLDTRKTTPALRFLEKYAVRVGGGTNHRMGLYDMVMIKDNHIKAAGSITKAANRIRKKSLDLYIIAEAQTLNEVMECINCLVDRIMLDNMGIELMSKAIAEIRKSEKYIDIEVSGGIDENTIAAICQLDIDYVSVGSMTHSYNSVDFSMKYKFGKE